MDYTNLKTLIEEERDEELLVLQKDVLAVIDKDINSHQHWQQKAEKSNHKVDRIARELLSDLHKCQRLPLKATADGNCLFNSCSILLIGTEKLARDLRVAVSIELFLQREFYRCHPFLTKKIDEDPTLKIDKLNNTIVKKECHDKEGDIIVKEAILNLKNHTWSSLMSMFALASVVKRNIVSVYPGDLSTFKPKLYNGTIYPINGKSDEKSLHILWSQINNLNVDIGLYAPNHFVPLIEETVPRMQPESSSKRPLSPGSEYEKPSKVPCLEIKKEGTTVSNAVSLNITAKKRLAAPTRGTAPKKLKSAKSKSLLDMLPRMEKTTSVPREASVHIPIVRPPPSFDAIVESPSGSLDEKEAIENFMDVADVFEILKTLSDKSKVELENRIWRPPKDFSFPKNKSNLRCKIEWIEKYKMLMYSKSKDALYCLSCILMDTNKTRSNLTKPSGFQNWNVAKTRLEKHFNTNHDSELNLTNLKICLRNPSLSIDATANRMLSATIVRNRRMIRPIIATMITLGKQNIAMRGHRDNTQRYLDENSGNHGNFLSILKLVCQFAPPELKELIEKCPRNATYKSKNIQNQIIDVLKDFIQETIVARIKKTKFFSVLADEASDVSNQEQMSLVLRYLNVNNEIKEEFVSFIHCNAGTSGEALSGYIQEEIKKIGLDFEHVRGQGYDGAGAMTGKEKGVAARIMKIFPLAAFVHCFSHRLNLSVMKATKIQMVKNLFEHVRVISDFINNSPKRSAFLKDVVNENDGEHEKLINICRTRWIQRIVGLERILANYVHIYKALCKISEGGDYHGVKWDAKSRDMANGLKHRMEDSKFLIPLVIVKEIFSYFASITKGLQDSTLSIVEAYQTVSNNITTLEGIKQNIRDHHKKWYIKARKLARKIGVTLKAPRTVAVQLYRDNTPTNNVEDYFRITVSKNCVEEVLMDLKSRFDGNSVAAVNGFYSVPSVMAARTEWKDKLKAFGRKYKADLGENYDTFDAELDNWETFWLVERKRDGLPETVEETFKQMYTTMFPNMFKVLHLVSVLPVTTCSCERSISTLRRVKTYLRNSMLQDRFVGLVLLNIHHDMPIDIDEIINRLAMKYPKRLKMSNMMDDD